MGRKILIISLFLICALFLIPFPTKAYDPICDIASYGSCKNCVGIVVPCPSYAWCGDNCYYNLCDCSALFQCRYYNKEYRPSCSDHCNVVSGYTYWVTGRTASCGSSGWTCTGGTSTLCADHCSTDPSWSKTYCVEECSASQGGCYVPSGGCTCVNGYCGAHCTGPPDNLACLSVNGNTCYYSQCGYLGDTTVGSCSCSSTGTCDSGYCQTGNTCYYSVSCTSGSGWSGSSCTLSASQECTATGCKDVCECTSGACCDGCHYKSSSTVCRAAAGVCDVAETCTGSSASCPSNSYKSSSTLCRAAADPDCDTAEYCTGSSASCPSNSYEPDGSQCPDDGNPCTWDYCSGGNCIHPDKPSIECVPPDTESQQCIRCSGYQYCAGAGQTRSCLSNCQWGAWSSCTGGSCSCWAGWCGAVCSTGQTQSQSCTYCSGINQCTGSQSRSCLPNCQWDSWGSCSGGSCSCVVGQCGATSCACVPGDTESRSCASCSGIIYCTGGTQTRTCSAGGSWGSWSSCTGVSCSCVAGQCGAVCSTGQTQSQSCTYCSGVNYCTGGSQSRSCLPDCQWGSWGSCSGGSCSCVVGQCGATVSDCGVCTPGQTQSQSCTYCSGVNYCTGGTQTRTCDSSGNWGAWGSCSGGSCSCVVGQCGAQCDSDSDCASNNCNLDTCLCEESVCECSSGDCCSDGCNFDSVGTLCRSAKGPCDLPEYCTGYSASCPTNSFRSSTYVCNEYYDVEYKCLYGTDCGDDVYTRHQRMYCSGSSASCNGATEWTDYTLHDDCEDFERCADGDSSCNYDILCADINPPVTTIKCNGETCRDDCWYNIDVSITLSCSDDAGGCDKTYYCYDSSNVCDPNSEYYSLFNLPEGINYVRYFSTDLSENVEATKSQKVKIDKSLTDNQVLETIVKINHLGSGREPIYLSYSVSSSVPGITVSFGTNPITTSPISIMTIEVEPGTPAGVYEIRVIGESESGLIRYDDFELSVGGTNGGTNCGNGIPESGEQCDDGNTNNNDACKNNCEWNVCGDGVIYTGVEQCDGSELGGESCKSQGFTGGGTLSCTASCTFDTSGCLSETTLNIIFSDDALVWDRYYDQNWGSHIYLMVGYLDSPSWACCDTTRSWVKVNLAPIPDGASITSAKLWLDSLFDESNRMVAVHFSSSDSWTENNIIWNNQPSFNPTVLDSIILTDGWNSWDVTSAIQAEHSGDKVASFVFKQEDETSLGSYNNNFASKEYGGGNPYLEVTYG